MSGVLKSAAKVFKKVVTSKVFKIAAIAAAVYFTGGLAAAAAGSEFAAGLPMISSLGETLGMSGVGAIGSAAEGVAGAAAGIGESVSGAAQTFGGAAEVGESVSGGIVNQADENLLERAFLGVEVLEADVEVAHAPQQR